MNFTLIVGCFALNSFNNSKVSPSQTSNGVCPYEQV